MPDTQDPFAGFPPEALKQIQDAWDKGDPWIGTPNSVVARLQHLRQSGVKVPPLTGAHTNAWQGNGGATRPSPPKPSPKQSGGLLNTLKNAVSTVGEGKGIEAKANVAAGQVAGQALKGVAEASLDPQKSATGEIARNVYETVTRKPYIGPKPNNYPDPLSIGASFYGPLYPLYAGENAGEFLINTPGKSLPEKIKNNPVGAGTVLLDAGIGVFHGARAVGKAAERVEKAKETVQAVKSAKATEKTKQAVEKAQKTRDTLDNENTAQSVVSPALPSGIPAEVKRVMKKGDVTATVYDDPTESMVVTAPKPPGVKPTLRANPSTEAPETGGFSHALGAPQATPKPLPAKLQSVIDSLPPKIREKIDIRGMREGEFTNAMDEGTGGRYDRKSKMVFVEKGETDPNTLLHEVLHNYTEKVNDPELLKDWASARWSNVPETAQDALAHIDRTPNFLFSPFAEESFNNDLTHYLTRQDNELRPGVRETFDRHIGREETPQAPASTTEAVPAEPLQRAESSADATPLPDNILAANPPGLSSSARIEPAPLQGGIPKRLSQIALDLSKNLGRKTQTAKGERRTLGVYYPGSGRTTIRFSVDLDTTSHEVAHALDDQHGIVSDWAGPRKRSPFDSELLQPALQHTTRRNYPLTIKRAEAVAEWVRAYIVNPEEAQRIAPQFYAHFIQKVPKDDLDSLHSFSNDVRLWAGGSNAQRTLANIRTELAPTTLAEKARDFIHGNGYDFETTGWEKLKAKWLDDLTPVRKGIQAAKSLRGMDEVLPSLDPEIAIRTHSGVIDKVNAIMEHGPVDAQNQLVPGLEGGFKKLLEPFDRTSEATLEKDMNDTLAMMTSQRVLDEGQKLLHDGRNPRAARISGVGGGVYSDYDTAQRTLQELANDPQRLVRLQEGARLYREWGDWLLSYMRDKGRLSGTQYAKIKAENPNWIDLHRVMEQSGIPFPERGTKRLGSVKEPIKAFTGSSREIENPYVSLMAQTYRVVQETDRNEALKLFRDLLTTNRGMYQGEALHLAGIGSKAKAGDENAIKIFVNGKPEYWQFEDGIHQALKGWGEVGSSDFLTALAGFMRNAVTHSPDFLVRNIIRDTVQRSIVSEVGSTPMDLFRGKNPNDLKNLQLYGGSQAGHYMTDKVDYYKTLRKAMRETADEGGIVAFPQQLAQGYERLTKGSEAVNRLAEFRKAREYAVKTLGYGEHDASLYAAAHSRDLLDFAVAGSTLRKLNKYIPFTNAAVQGLRKTVASASKNPKAFLAAWTTYALAPTIAVYTWNRSQGPDVLEEYRQLPAYQRDLFWNFKVGPDTWLRVPKPFELGVLASGLERAIDRASGNPQAMEGYLGSLVKTLMPVDESAVAGPLRPLVENLANYDFFRGKSIVPPHEDDLALSERKGTENASRVGILLQHAFHGDARKWDHLITSFGGGLARTGLNIADVGREDKRKNPVVTTGNALTGLFAPSPVSAARDVQYVTETARQYKKGNDSRLKKLRKSQDKYYDALNNTERDLTARHTRTMATKLRPIFEKVKQKQQQKAFLSGKR
jgi:hypothetical protein